MQRKSTANPARYRPRHAWGLIPVAALMLCASCMSGEKAVQLERENITLRERVNVLNAALTEGQKRNDELIHQLDALRELGPAWRQHLFIAERIEFARLSGGHDTDGQPGDDAIVLYVRPLDEAGNVVTAAGGFTVTLFDLANPEGSREIGHYAFGVDRAKALWYDQFATRHYKLTCPWPAGRLPDHREITARAEFTDALTGKAMVAQDRFAITFP